MSAQGHSLSGLQEVGCCPVEAQMDTMVTPHKNQSLLFRGWTPARAFLPMWLPQPDPHHQSGFWGRSHLHLSSVGRSKLPAAPCF